MCEPRRFFPFAGAGLMFWGASVQRRERSPLEDPVKNGAI